MRHEPMVRGYAVTHPPGEVRLPTQAGWHQVLYTASGALIAKTRFEAWTVPPHRALLIGDNSRLAVLTKRPTAVRCLYVHHSLDVLPAAIRVVDVPALTRELLLHAVEHSPIDIDLKVNKALLTLLAAQLETLPSAPLQLPFPNDERAMSLATTIIAEPAQPLGSLTRHAGASRRTLERLFKADTCLTLAMWQRRARMLASVELLGEGFSVTEVSSRVGYSTPSSFVAAFRTEMGTTPSNFKR